MAKHPYDDNADDLRLEEIAGSDRDLDDDRGRRRGGKRKGFFARHKVLTAFLVLVGLLVGGVVGFAVYLNTQLGNVDTYVSKIGDDQRVPKAAPTEKAPISSEVVPTPTS